jgi:hypothetical protein
MAMTAWLHLRRHLSRSRLRRAIFARPVEMHRMPAGASASVSAQPAPWEAPESYFPASMDPMLAICLY